MKTTTTKRISTGFQFLDDISGGGFAEGETWMIQGASGTGRTTMALNLFRNMAIGGNIPGFLNSETRKIDSIHRCLANETGIDSSRLIPELLSSVEKEKLRAIIPDMKDRECFITDHVFDSDDQILALLNDWTLLRGVKLIVMDRLDYGTPNLGMAHETMARLKELAEQNGVTVVVTYPYDPSPECDWTIRLETVTAEERQHVDIVKAETFMGDFSMDTTELIFEKAIGRMSERA